MTRAEALDVVRERGDDTPLADIEAFCRFSGISKREFFEIIEPFRNLDIWSRKDGVWVIPDFIIEDWDWRASDAVASV